MFFTNVPPHTNKNVKYNPNNVINNIGIVSIIPILKYVPKEILITFLR